MLFRLIMLLICLSSIVNATELKSFSADSLQFKSKNEIKEDLWFGRDKGLHLAGSFILSGFTSQALKRFSKSGSDAGITIGISFTFSLGMAKEIYDGQKSNNIFSYKDLTADALGVLIGFLVFK